MAICHVEPTESQADRGVSMEPMVGADSGGEVPLTPYLGVAEPTLMG